ncbi:unnamed protein product [Vitrella brassicaformis CCMP3155]|uniref:Uncharacterized protein n=1 Tax=Vitrella brassicaformis (strain CCMP3155) TaxID=1169540 RepID=A0A0G4FE02_VITBC|nr:unnamed protein product [Vitrella brassicaformis CCMP3155]|eukprot:CEM11100.1 unnamed protein product [Vitrella brassicaformis CCMP3155]
MSFRGVICSAGVTCGICADSRRQRDPSAAKGRTAEQTRSVTRWSRRPAQQGQGTDADRDVLVECGAVASVKTLLQSAEPPMRLTGCLTMAFVTGGSPAHLQAVIDAGLVPLLVDAAREEPSGTAARTTGIVARGSQRQIEHVIECGGIQPLRGLLNGDTLRMLSGCPKKQANEGLPENPYCRLVEQAGGVEKLVELQAHNDGNIAVQAMAILIDYFPARVDAQRLEALIQAGVIHVVPEPGGGEDDRATHVSDSDGDEEADGQLYGHGEDQEEKIDRQTGRFLHDA